MQLTHSRATQPATNLRAFFALLWRRWLVLLTVFVLVGIAVGATLAFSDREYTAVGRVAATPPEGASQSPAGYDELLGTLADVAESRPVLLDVQRKVPGRTLAQLQEEVKGEVVFGTVMVQVAVTDTDPTLAAQIANAVIADLPDHDPSNGFFVLSTTQPAVVPTNFTSPDVKLVVLAGVLLAIALSIATAVVYDRLARTIQNAEEVAEATGANVLGVLPRPSQPSGLTVGDPSAPEFQGLRALRVALEFASSDQPTRSLVVAGATTDPWGGWLEVNLAAALAEVGHRVLLVDGNRADRRRHPVFDLPGEPGLYDMLAGSASLDGAAVAGPVDGVTVLPLGNADLAAPSLLEMRFRSLLDDIDEKYDVILIHAAPVTESDDARIMAIGGGLLLTVPARKVKPSALEQAVADLRNVRTRIVGCVLLGSRSQGRRV